MNIHQLSVIYVPEQDRILFRVNTLDHDEFKFWVTRRLALAMWPVVNEALVLLSTRHTAGEGGIKASIVAPDANTKKLLAEFKAQEELQSADFATPYDNQASSFPLGTDPLLVTEVSVKPMESGQLQLVFHEAVPGQPTPRGFQMALEQQMTHGMVALLQRAMVNAQWLDAADIAKLNPAPGGNDGNGDGGQDLDPDASNNSGTPPKYIN